MPRRSVACSSSSSSLASSTSVSPASAWKQQPGPDHVWDLLITCILYMVHQNNYLRYIQYMIYIIYIQYEIFGYLMISPIRVGYCVQVRVNMGRCTTDYWWKCGIGNLSQTANGGLRLYTVWSRAASPMRNLWKPGAKSLCICICVHLLYLFILDSRCYSQIKSCHIYSVYQRQKLKPGQTTANIKLKRTHIWPTDFLRIWLHLFEFLFLDPDWNISDHHHPRLCLGDISCLRFRLPRFSCLPGGHSP